MLVNRRGMGDGVAGNGRQIWHSRVLRCVLRVRGRVAADSAEIPGYGHRFLHRRHWTPQLSLYCPLSSLLAGAAPHRHGLAQCRWSHHVDLPARDTQHPPTPDDRGGRVVWRGLQAVVVPDPALKVSTRLNSKIADFYWIWDFKHFVSVLQTTPVCIMCY